MQDKHEGTTIERGDTEAVGLPRWNVVGRAVERTAIRDMLDATVRRGLATATSHIRDGGERGEGFQMAIKQIWDEIRHGGEHGRMSAACVYDPTVQAQIRTTMLERLEIPEPNRRTGR